MRPRLRLEGSFQLRDLGQLSVVRGDIRLGTASPHRIAGSGPSRRSFPSRRWLERLRGAGYRCSAGSDGLLTCHLRPASSFPKRTSLTKASCRHVQESRPEAIKQPLPLLKHRRIHEKRVRCRTDGPLGPPYLPVKTCLAWRLRLSKRCERRKQNRRLRCGCQGDVSRLAKTLATSALFSVPQVHSGTIASARLRPSGVSASSTRGGTSL